MTKEIEFLEKQGYIFDKDKYLLFMEEFFSSEHKIKDICDLLSKYADQETKMLKAELAEKDKLNEKLNNECDIYVAELTKLIERVKELESELEEKDKEIEILKVKCDWQKTTIDDLRNKGMDNRTEILNLQSELSELKERHKRDVCGFTEWIRKQIVSNSIKCYEDDGKFTLWKPYTPYGSRLTVIELYDYYKQKFKK